VASAGLTNGSTINPEEAPSMFDVADEIAERD